MAVQHVMGGDLGGRFDRLERISVHLDVRLKLVFEGALIFAIDLDCALVFTLTRLGSVCVDLAKRHAKVLGMLRVSSTVWHEKELVITDEQLAQVFRLHKLSHLKPVYWLLFLLVVESGQVELFLSASIELACNLGGIHLRQVAQ